MEQNEINNSIYSSSDDLKSKPQETIPSGIKRRMSLTSKLATQVALELYKDESVDYVIFSSQHGEIERTCNILTDIANRQAISPTAFSQSVHNTASGLFTIISQCTAPVSSICAKKDSLKYAIYDAYTYLACSPNATVLIVHYDQVPPAPLNTGFANQPPYAFGALLTFSDDASIDLGVDMPAIIKQITTSTGL
ncbi:beta-ketoacyl synthase chain length factor [Thaumasiovibrio sp. DFM-14]|uniref:beta-ketoacyl synthase chain length factor n=1 Tax=Thaumasiovibrio sp. DFM-14 TaxID=3384792 RepID=UPI0039A23732